MPFVKDIQAILGGGQNHAPAQTQVRQYQVMICHDDVCLFEAIAGAEKTALRHMWATPPRALTLIRCDQAPRAR